MLECIAGDEQKRLTNRLAGSRCCTPILRYGGDILARCTATPNKFCIWQRIAHSPYPDSYAIKSVPPWTDKRHVIEDPFWGPIVEDLSWSKPQKGNGGTTT